MKHLRTMAASSSPPVLKAVALLESLGEQSRPQTLSELSRACHLPKASALRYLAALESAGYARRDPRTGGFSLGARVVRLSRHFFEQNRLIADARSALPALARESGETAHLAVLQAPFVVYIDQAESPRHVRAFVARGERLPAYCVASGRAILAHAEAALVNDIIAGGLAPRTPATITGAERFRAELATAAARGYATSIGEWMEDVVGIASPLFAPSAEVLGAIGVSCPVSRVDSARIAELGELVRTHAVRLSELHLK